MACAHSGHLTHSPSGTRLAFSGAAMGFRTRLNHAISWTDYREPGPWASLVSGTGHVIARPARHPLNLPEQIVERRVGPGQIDMGRFDHQQRRRRVVEEEVVERLVQLGQPRENAV